MLKDIIVGKFHKGDAIKFLNSRRRRDDLGDFDNPPLFSRLIEIGVRQVYLKNADTGSSEFILAFAESLAFLSNVHKSEFLMKLATLLHFN